jgi:hypothetical protein
MYLALVNSPEEAIVSLQELQSSCKGFTLIGVCGYSSVSFGKIADKQASPLNGIVPALFGLNLALP